MSDRRCDGAVAAELRLAEMFMAGLKIILKFGP
jgi:hypothetical protein